ncbi:septum formation family protein [Dactylosporangium sp. CA-092794]|uniref:septum formation family protein n=1 Tax=Dactylosporangium sp. CA-092794 TaxID=3239929 RepID=UPI003D8FB796
MTGVRSGPAMLLTLLVVALLAACAAPAGTDGDLVDGWPMLPAASYAPPRPGECLTGGTFSAFEQPDRAAPAPVDCAQPHLVEVVWAGPMPDAAAAPAWDSDATRAAYAACDAAATAYVGGDWHGGRLLPYLSIPGAAAWRGGVRTAVCGLAEAADDLFAPLARTGSLRDGLKDPRPLALDCVDLQGGDVSPEGFYRSVDAVTPVPCADPHDTEFVGVWTAPAGPFPADAQALNATVSKACFTAVAAFLGLTETQLYNRKDVYTFWDGLTVAQWRLGDRAAHCFLNVSTNNPLHRSLRGLGTAPLPAS